MDKLLKEFKKTPQQSGVELAKRLKISRQALHKKLKPLLREEKILKIGQGPKNTFFLLNTSQALQKTLEKNSSFQKKILLKNANEDRIYKDIELFLQLPKRLKPNVEGILHYAFTEMLNNAIDHSESKQAKISLDIFQHQTRFTIDDTGIGLFRNIETKKNLQNEMEAIQDLIKGKQTTQPEKHSGQGIFFTSKIGSLLEIQSHHKKLSFNNRLKDIFIKDIRFKKGTRILFEIEHSSTLLLKDIFDQFTNEELEFDKSLITVKLFKEGKDFISRAEAKRLLASLNHFKRIVLDFKDVKSIGQGFADEIFRVFKNQYSDIEIIPIHMHENVEFMVKRAMVNEVV